MTVWVVYEVIVDEYGYWHDHQVLGVFTSERLAKLWAGDDECRHVSEHQVIELN